VPALSIQISSPENQWNQTDAEDRADLVAGDGCTDGVCDGVANDDTDACSVYTYRPNSALPFTPVATYWL